MKGVKKFFVSILMAITAALCLGLGAACDEEEFSYEGGGTSNAEYVQIYNLNPSNTPVQMSILDGRFVFRAPTRAGLVFEGLYDAAGLQIVDKDGNCLILVQNGLQLYARWSKMECTVYFNAGEDGTMDEEELSQTFEYDSDLSSFPTPTPVVGKEFVCWLNGETPVTDEDGNLLEGKDKLTGENFTFTEDTKVYLTAQYQVKKFTYTFDYQDEDYDNKSGTVEYGATFATIRAEFPELVDTGSRELVGWSTDAYSMVEITDETAIVEDVTLYAIWQEYKTFYFYEDVGVSATPVKIYQGNNEMYQPAQKNGYEFIGWYTNNYFGGNAVQSINYYSANELYWARWEMETYTLTFESNGGGSFAAISYTIEDYKELPAPEKTNFTFVGWCMNEDLSDTPRKVISVGSFGGGKMYAKYKGIDRTAKFETNGGTLSQEQATVEYGAKYTLAVPTYEGFAFAGWFDGDGDNAKKLTDSKGVSYEIWGYLDEETTLYAKYTKKYYVNIEYKDKDGLSTSVGATAQVEEYYVSGEPAKFTVTVDEGYYYGGIYNNNGARVTREKEYTFNMPAADCTFVIQVYPETYTLTFELSGGTMEDKTPVSVTYGESFVLPVPYKKAHIFKGWLYNDELCTNENGESLSNTQITDNGKLTAKFEENPAFENYTEITTAEEFLAIAQNPAGVYVLGKNIDLTGKSWTAVDFSGSLDGSGFKVSGLTTNLFNTVTGTVKNLKLDVNISVTHTGDTARNLGALAAEASNATIENIIVYGTVTANGAYSNVTGVVASINDSKTLIRNCKNYANITSTGNGNYAGGVFGSWRNGSSFSAYGCENHGTVTGYNAGGICAYFPGELTLKECLNYGTVTGTALAGGIISRTGTKAILNACGSYGTIVCENGTAGKYAAQTNVSYVNLKPISITSASELAWLSGCIAQEVFVLKNDIDMSGVAWTPVNFAATLDGAGHKIKNFSISTESDNLGFFLTLTGTVKNLKFENVNVESTSTTNVRVGVLAAVVGAGGLVQKVEVLSGSVKATAADLGGIVGCMDGNGTIEGCKNYASVATTAVTDASGNTGGILGYITDGIIRDCENNGTVSGQYRVGGVIGGAYMGGTRAFNNLVNKATVTGSANFVGGVIGRWGATYHLDVTATWKNEGAVTGAQYVGGIIGQVYNSLSDRYTTYTTKLNGYTNSAKVTGAQYVGGVFGYVYGYNSHDSYMNVFISNVKNTGDVTGTSDVGGIAGYVYSETTGSTLSGVSSGKITAEWKVGGIVGWVDNITLTDCSNVGTQVSATKPSMDSSGIYYAYLGGYAGRAVAIKNCNNASDITCTAGGRFVGGIAGYATSDVQNCSNMGAITAESSDYVGGIAGYISVGWGRTYSKLSNSGEIIGLSHTGGIFGELYNYFSDRYTTYTMTLQNLQNSGDVKNVDGDYAGGLVGVLYGYNSHDSGLKIVGSELKNTGDVTGRRYVGGLIGHGYAEWTDSQLSGESSAKITAEEGYVGGLAGYLQNIALVDCSNTDSLVKANKYILDGTSYYVYLGGYVGYGYRLVNCHNSVAITHVEKGDFVGGLAGRIVGLTVENCSNQGAVTAIKSAYVGGLVGCVNTSYGRTYQGLNNTGAVTGTEQVGGVFGRLYDEFSDRYTTYTLTLQDVKNSGDVTGSEHAVGGLIGYLYGYNSHDSGLKIVGTELKNVGAVSGKSYVGGLIGDGYAEWADSQLTGESSGAVSAEYMVGGLAGRLRNIQLVSCSNLGSTVTATKYELITGSTPTYNAYLGGYVGYGYRIVGCENATEIIYTEKGNYVGGIAGLATGEIQNCSNSATVTATKSNYVGGLVGRVTFGGTRTLSGLSNSGAVTGASHVGGMFGELHNDFSDRYNSLTMSLQSIQNSGAVTGSADYVGGIVGYLYHHNTHDSVAIISAMECTNTAKVVSTGAYVGGLFGYTWSEGASTLLESASSGAISGAYYVGGLAGYAGNMIMQDCSNKGTSVEATGAYYNTGEQCYYTWLGGYAGFGYGFIGCENEVSISYEKLGRYVGGIVGYMSNSSLQSCTNKGDIYAPKAAYVGGIAGRTDRHSSLTYTALENSGNITGDNHVGGLIGHVYFVVNDRYNNHTIAITTSSNSGAVTGNSQVGGIAGYLYAHNSHDSGALASLAELANSGAVTGTTETGAYFGKFWAERASTMVGSTNSGTVTVDGAESPETLVGTNTNLTIVVD